MVSKVRGFMATRRGAFKKLGSATYNDIIETLSMAMIVRVSKGMVILPEIPQGRRTDP